jgi:hypothetical protein
MSHRHKLVQSWSTQGGVKLEADLRDVEDDALHAEALYRLECDREGDATMWHNRHCDRTTSEMRGLSPKIILGDSRRSENAQTHTHKHMVQNMKFKLKLLQIKCHVLEFTKDKAQIVLEKIIRIFAEAFVSHDRHTLFALEESGPPRTTYTCESQ